jgi:hypothetical protein
MQICRYFKKKQSPRSTLLNLQTFLNYSGGEISFPYFSAAISSFLPKNKII